MCLLSHVFQYLAEYQEYNKGTIDIYQMSSIELKEKLGTERRNNVVIPPLLFTAFGQEREECFEEQSRDHSIDEGRGQPRIDSI